MEAPEVNLVPKGHDGSVLETGGDPAGLNTRLDITGAAL
jgi:hypothetical protein